MIPDLASIKNQQVKTFYILYWTQHQILIDFYNLLPEEQFDYCLTETISRRADTPRESLAHVIYVQYVYLNGVQTGKLEFRSLGTEHFTIMPKVQLMAEWEKCDQLIYTFLTADSFDSTISVDVPWGGSMNCMDLLFFLRDHDILHIGWNLALIDMLNLPRYPSLAQYWG